MYFDPEARDSLARAIIGTEMHIVGMPNYENRVKEVADALEVAFSGTVYVGRRNGYAPDRRYNPVSYGQVVEDLRRAQSSQAQRIAYLWERWHLNGMRPNCTHMPTIEYTPGLTCPETGYESGTEWLYEPIPADVLAEIRRIFPHAAS